MKCNIPFELHGKVNQLTVEYKININPSESGFDAIKSPGFRPETCIGYPTLHAYIETHELTGFKRYCGWIQLVEDMRFNCTSAQEPYSKAIKVDNTGAMKTIGIPYHSFGFPAEFYHAPCFGVGKDHKLKWTAYTYLVDMPSLLNQNKLRYLAGFSWGYSETRKHSVTVSDFKILNIASFYDHLPILTKECPIVENWI